MRFDNSTTETVTTTVTTTTKKTTKPRKQKQKRSRRVKERETPLEDGRRFKERTTPLTPEQNAAFDQMYLDNVLVVYAAIWNTLEGCSDLGLTTSVVREIAETMWW